MDIRKCTLCPRKCGADRTAGGGYCKGGASVKVARAALHFWEEPPLSGENGSGTVFFSGCPLRCCFCQNHRISSENYGKEISVRRLSEIFLELQEQKAHNINLVSPTHYVPWIISALELVKNKLVIPVVYNTGGYETVETLRMLDGYIDIYLPDLKYFDSAAAGKYSSAPDYFKAASKAVLEMHRQVGKTVLGEDGMMRRGLLIRHLVLPGGRKDSAEIMEWIASNLPKDEVRLSLMSQYTPCFESARFREINRPVTTFEYRSVVDRAVSLGLSGFMQEKSAARDDFIPAFDLTGV